MAFGSGWTWNVGLFIGSAFKDLPLRHDLLLHQTVDSSVNTGIDPNSLLPPGFSASSYWHRGVPRSHVLSHSTNSKYLSPPATDLGITFLNATCRTPPLCVDCLDASRPQRPAQFWLPARISRAIAPAFRSSGENSSIRFRVARAGARSPRPHSTMARFIPAAS